MRLLPLCLFLVPLCHLTAQDAPKAGFNDRVHKEGDKEYKYVLFVPQDYDKEKTYPVILFLHGLGESGTDGKKQATVGLGKALKEREKTFPAFVIFPQSANRNWTAKSDDAKRALAILDSVQKEFKIDEKRVYLTGLSMGGIGSWSLAAAFPDKWAAVVPVCGRGDAKTAVKFKDTPVWAFHGDKDGSVPVSGSRDMVEALKAAEGMPKYTEYKNVGHNCWDKAYGTDELYEWMFKQTRK